MENDLIRREDAITTLTILADKMTADGAIMMDRAADVLKDIPAVDAVEVRHGRWVVDGYYLTCSECEELYVFDEYLPDLDMDKDLNLRWCPSCGARMDGRREDGDA